MSSLDDALAKLNWSVKSEWSATIRPNECKELLIAYEELLLLRRVNNLPVSICGDPGDETNAE